MPLLKEGGKVMNGMQNTSQAQTYAPRPLKRLRCALMTCGKTWTMDLEAYEKVKPVYLCPQCSAKAKQEQ
jgi:hypothetical protein